jgi:hypothetical protein
MLTLHLARALPFLWIKLEIHMDLRLSGTPDKCLLAWCNLFVSAEKWNAKYVALIPVPSNKASFWQTSVE